MVCDSVKKIEAEQKDTMHARAALNNARELISVLKVEINYLRHQLDLPPFDYDNISMNGKSST